MRISNDGYLICLVSDLIDRLRHKVVPAVPVPFDSRGEIDGTAMLRYAQWMVSQPVGAVAVWAHTGRGLLLTESQRAQVLETWRATLGGTPIICGVGAPGSERIPTDSKARTDRVMELTVSLAEQAVTGSAAGVLVYPPTALRGLSDVDQRVVEIHRAVAEVGLPVIAFYLYRDAGGISYAIDTVHQLLDLDGVIGIKLATLDSVMTFQDITWEVLRHQDALLISGEDRFLGYSLTLGAHGALIGMAAACTDVCSALLTAWFERDLETYAELSATVDKFARATFREPMDGYVQRMLWALEADRVMPANPHDPFGPELSTDERTVVHRAVAELRNR